MRDMNQVIFDRLNVLSACFNSLDYCIEELQCNGKITLNEWLSIKLRIKEAEYEAFNVIIRLVKTNDEQESKHGVTIEH